jgi:1-aminocyclopropane-1-carboxylate deaminase/D-cysteine desulfhydrase-like pyridoxal-dependent ACC family enzyme
LIEINHPTPIENFLFRGENYYLKRDELLHPFFSGNKARKLWFLFDKDLSNYNKLISYGSAQSNAMLSLSFFAKVKGLEFDYYVSHIADFLVKNPHGNYEMALKNGMNLIVGEYPKDFLEDELFIHEGGYEKEAEIGLKVLANEIREWAKEKKKNIDIFLPSGTGTTALFLQKNLPEFKVWTTPCVSDRNYLKKEFLGLCKDESLHPFILDTPKKYYFAKLYKEFYDIWKELKNAGIEFDLVYDPKGWVTMLYHKKIFKKEILYIHQGGILGNISMLRRYERKFGK